MNTTVCRGAVVGLLVFLAACGGSAPTAPTATAPPTPPAREFSPLSGLARTFVSHRELSYTVAEYTKTSRFVLYDNGAFVLQYVGLADYRGQYAEAPDGSIIFMWEGSSLAGDWGATGTLKGGMLSVQYNRIMQLTDFDDAVYVLSP